MNFVIRSLLILVIFTTASYGEQVEAPEKSLLDRIIEVIFPERVPEVVPQAISVRKAEDKASQTSSVKKVGDKDSKSTTTGRAVEAPKKTVEKTLPEISVGSKDAPVVMINYSSLSCGHCAHFHDDVLPKIQEKYIKPGYLRIIFRDYPGDQVSLRAHQLAWCKGEMKYLDFIKILYTNQDKWLLVDDPVAALKAIALQNGIAAKQFDECLKNQELLDQIIAMRLDGQKKYNITATPTIIINAKIYQKALSLGEIDDIMKPLLVSSLEKAKKG